MNPFLARLGYADSDRVLITHADDMGFCHAATAECLQSGATSCASVLVNAPWFPEAERLCRDNPGFDVGVHLTLTSEYDGIRWSALSATDRATGMLDDEGYLWRTVAEAVANVPPEAAKAEMRAQIDRALAAGIDVTHIDTHMGTVVHPRHLQDYLDLAREYAVPAFLPRPVRERIEALLQSRGFAAEYVAALDSVSEADTPMLDAIVVNTLLPLRTAAGTSVSYTETRSAGLARGSRISFFTPRTKALNLPQRRARGRPATRTTRSSRTRRRGPSLPPRASTSSAVVSCARRCATRSR